ncbi:helix-turn-helix domain-containing protein [Candidatus Pacearchaeota archaeon]|nr:helix-turn-helix domain-containing protein [Candidatus Pacearchaeota archaeon]
MEESERTNKGAFDRVIALQIRRKYGMTQRRLKEITGINESTISHYENGHSIPRAQDPYGFVNRGTAGYLKWLSDHGYNPYNLDFESLSSLPVKASPESKPKKDEERHLVQAKMLAGREERPENLDEILGHVRELRRVVSEHPIVLKSDANYLRELYTEQINRRRDNLRFFMYEGERIPFVLVNSRDLRGFTGRVLHNLYFVAEDLAPEEWQQKIVAYHESLCAIKGHEVAKEMEIKLAKKLKVKKKYELWRKKIDEMSEDL